MTDVFYRVKLKTGEYVRSYGTNTKVTAFADNFAGRADALRCARGMRATSRPARVVKVTVRRRKHAQPWGRLDRMEYWVLLDDWNRTVATIIRVADRYEWTIRPGAIPNGKRVDGDAVSLSEAQSDVADALVNAGWVLR